MRKVKSVTKAELAKRIAKEYNIKQGEAYLMVGAVFNTARKVIDEGENLSINGFGRFSHKMWNERRILHPQTGEELILPPRDKVKFTFTKALNDSDKAIEDYNAVDADDVFTFI